MNHPSRCRLLLAGNIILALLLLAVCLHEDYAGRLWHRWTAPPPHPYSYSDNTFFHEVLDFDTLFHEPRTIVMLGNSLTQKMEWQELLNRCDVATRGVQGDVTGGILARVPYVLRLKPHIVFIEGGINDIDRSVAEPKILSNLRQVALRLHAQGVLPVLTAITHVSPVYASYDSVNKIIARLNDSLADFSAHQGFDFINLNPQIAPGGTLNPAFSRADGCHLNAAAYSLWAKEIRQVLARRGI
ncbi:MAG: hypothetical protein JST06_06295 [Bacteroidetes bacterium]|nr:hypothetical protein [Bacteroidota bacterium]MBS1629220.1 hypothetical protein [Bacteroidota bacterium]